MKNILLLFMVLSICFSCATNVKSPDANFQSSDQEALVFGRVQVFKDGQEIIIGQPLKGNNQKIIISKYYSSYKEPCCEQSVNEQIASELIMKNGYFYVPLKPGKYCIFGFITLDNAELVIKGLDSDLDQTERFTKLFPDHSYSTTYYGKPALSKNNLLIYFDVIPNQATYIGTIQVLFNMLCTIGDIQDKNWVYPDFPNNLVHGKALDKQLRSLKSG